MKAPDTPHPAWRARARAIAGGALVAGSCVLAAACSGTGPSSASSGSGTAAGSAALPARQPGPDAAAQAGGKPATGTRLTALRSRAIVYTAGLTLRSRDVSGAMTRAAQVASAAGGYVASENQVSGRDRRNGPVARLQLKLPVAAYQRVLAALSSGRLGTRVTFSQHARDVTQAVADTGSRAASARAAIAQLRGLLRRAGSVSELLAVQDQINSEESSLEALQAQQRALSRETSYATVSLLIEGRHAAVPPGRKGGGFTGGLVAGWHALAAVAVAVLTGLGAVLPFAVPLAAAGWLGYLARRRLRRRARPSPAG